MNDLVVRKYNFPVYTDTHLLPDGAKHPFDDPIFIESCQYSDAYKDRIVGIRHFFYIHE